MDIHLSLDSIKKTTVTFLHRFHVMIFALVVLVGLIVIVYISYTTILSSTNTEGLTPQTTSTTFDQATINRINELKSRDQSSSELDFSQGRSNPFVE